MPSPFAVLSLLPAVALTLAPPFSEPIGPTVPGGRTLTPSQRRAVEERQPAGIQHTRCDSGSVTVNLPVVDLYPLMHATGDPDLGAAAELAVLAKIQPTKTRLFVTVVASAADRSTRGSVDRRGSGFSKTKMFFEPVPVPDGCEIASVTTPSGRIRDRRSGDAPFATVKGDGFVKSASCQAGVTGVDRGKVGCRSIAFHPIEVHLRKAQPGCGPVAIDIPPQDLGLSRMQGNPDLGLSNVSKVEMNSGVVTREGKQAIRLSGTVSTSGTFARADGEVIREIFDVAQDAPGCVVRSVSVSFSGSRRRRKAIAVSPRTGGFELTVRTPATDAVFLGGRYLGVEGDKGVWGNLTSARCVVNTPGDDAGEIGCTDIRIRTLTLLLDPAAAHAG